MSDGSPQRGTAGSLATTSALVRGLDWFVPESVRAAGAEVRERARLLVGVCAIVLGFFGLVAGFEWTQGTAWIAGTSLIFGSLFAGLPLLLRATGVLILVTLAIALTYERLERRAFREAADARAEAEEQRKRIEREVKLRELLERREQERSAPAVRAQP